MSAAVKSEPVMNSRVASALSTGASAALARYVANGVYSAHRTDSGIPKRLRTTSET